jgi:hypothetical protein
MGPASRSNSVNKELVNLHRGSVGVEAIGVSRASSDATSRARHAIARATRTGHATRASPPTAPGC